ncbi:tRNA-specific adenosine deaminase [Marinobacterium nitratireducens]|uniref:tRNA-specific adenosine deaminase n=1 Tax=Marinobacterium nitratireducens TaxID=518897 RepID=A0A917Z9W2_9GAMM|nr:nucleoside deaminase [Marinobacterium nitratireducens]GGO78440.1 tRNA-specific adenosine deaminase [Marinobacterium nitratireducens]
MPNHQEFLQQALQLAEDNLADGGQPFGAVIVRDGEVLATGVNGTVRNQDPTSHSEIEAIRSACRSLRTPRLDGAVIYASGYPCAMCMSAILLTGIDTVFYAYGEEDGARHGLATEPVYQVLRRLPESEGLTLRPLPVALPDEHLYARWQAACGAS